MQRFFFCLFLILISNFGFSQFSDNFSDGNLSDNPTWQGDLSDFQITDGELQLNATAAGTSSIFAQINLPDSAIWEIYSRMNFNPSGSNQLRIYLQLDNQDVAQANGYYIEIGETGSEDNLKFYRMDEGTPLLIAEGTLSALASNPEFRLKISRKANGDWTVETDYAGGTDFTIDDQFFDPTYLAVNGWFGLECSYTSTRTDAFFFDDINVQPLLPDTQGPELIAAEPLDETTLFVEFSENVNETTATNLSNYNVQPSIGEPTSVSWNGAEVELNFSTPFQNGQNTLTVENISDEMGNIVPTQSIDFSFVKVEGVQPYDLLITEIMADPTPALGLPDAEWVEIYNRSDKTLSLEELLFADGSSERELSGMLLPNEYAIICDDDDLATFEVFGKVIPLSSFPSLTNGGELLTLKNTNNEIIHAVDFSDSWYMDAGKKEGGWTLELINPQTPCLGAENWIASTNLNGGTPGRQNSVFQNTPDETFPDLLTVFPDLATELVLTFSEGLDFTTAENISNYTIEPFINIQSAIPQPPLFQQVKLILSEPLQEGEIYNIKVENGVADCAGNTIGMKNELQFALPAKIEPGDLIINEILFNPQVGGVDFLEVYNLSGKVLDLSDLLIGRVVDGDTQVFGVENSYLLFPESLAALTEDKMDVLSRYAVPNPSALIETQLPTMPDDEGNVKLFVEGIFEPLIIDDLNYSKDWHHPLLSTEEGVSLERIDPAADTDNSNNWQSAAESVGFATPTGMNSQFKGANTNIESGFSLNPSSFSPNDDGVDDFLQINYSLEGAGFLANTTIFDAAGRPIKTLSQNELLGIEGFLRWDGDTDDITRAKSGIYIVYIQIFAPDGTVREFKEPVVLALPFD